MAVLFFDTSFHFSFTAHFSIYFLLLKKSAIVFSLCWLKRTLHMIDRIAVVNVQ